MNRCVKRVISHRTRKYKSRLVTTKISSREISIIFKKEMERILDEY